MRPGVELSQKVISSVEKDTLVYPLERRTNSQGIVRFRISRDSKVGWISEKDTAGNVVFEKVEVETVDMTAAKVEAVKEDKERLTFTDPDGDMISMKSLGNGTLQYDVNGSSRAPFREMTINKDTGSVDFPGGCVWARARARRVHVCLCAPPTMPTHTHPHTRTHTHT